MAAGEWIHILDNGDGTITVTNNDGETVIVPMSFEQLDQVELSSTGKEIFAQALYIPHTP